MKNWKLTNWCNVAVHKIRYGPDREAVFLELKQHLDERSDSFLAKGLSKTEATEKTLEVMGDPGADPPPFLGLCLFIFQNPCHYSGRFRSGYWGCEYDFQPDRQ